MIIIFFSFPFKNLAKAACGRTYLAAGSEMLLVGACYKLVICGVFAIDLNLS